MSIKKCIWVWLLPRLLNKSCPTQIPRTGEAAKKVNCYSVYLGTDEQRPTYLVDAFDKENLELSVRYADNNDTYSIPKIISLSEAMTEGMQVRLFYGIYNAEYKNLYHLSFNDFFYYDKFRIKCLVIQNYISQSIFNQKRLITKDSIKLLRFMLERQLNDGADRSTSWSANRSGINSIFLLTYLHSPRAMWHPNFAKERARLDLHLEALKESKNLVQNSSNQYIVTGNALLTLEKYEENERRHKDAVRLQRAVVFLTCIIAFTALVEAKMIDWAESKKAILHYLDTFF